MVANVRELVHLPALARRAMLDEVRGLHLTPAIWKAGNIARLINQATEGSVRGS